MAMFLGAWTRRFWLFTLFLGILPSVRAVNIQFTNSSGLASSNIYIAFQAGSSLQSGFYAVYGSGSTPFVFGTSTVGTNTVANVMTTNVVSLADLGTQGITLTNMQSGRIYIGYGSPFQSTVSSPSLLNPSATDYYLPTSYIELTYGSGQGKGDISYIDNFSAPIKVTTFTGGLGGTALSTNGLYAPPQTIVNQIAAISAGGSSGTNFIYNTNGQLVRVNGATQYTTTYTWEAPPTNYFQHLQSNNVVTVVSNARQYGGIGGTNWLVTPIMNATVTNDYQLALSGSFTSYYWTTNFSEGTAGPTFTNVTMLLAATNYENLLSVMLAAAPNPAELSFGGGWSDFTNYFATNAPAVNSDMNQVPIDDYYAAILLGLAGSTVTNTASGDVLAVKEYPTGHYWNWTTPISFSEAQTNPEFYDPYGSIFYNNSSNSVYGYAYSDRFNNNQILFNMGTFTVGTNVTNYDTILIDVGVPVTSIPEAQAALYITLGTIGIALGNFVRGRFRKPVRRKGLAAVRR